MRRFSKFSFINLLKIILPAIICFLLVYFGDGYNHLYLLIIPFSTSVIIFNLEKLRYGVILSIFISHLILLATLSISILLGLAIGYPIEYLFELMEINDNSIEQILNFVGVLTYSIISPLMIFYLTDKILHIEKNKIGKILKILTLVLLSLIIIFLNNDKTFTIALWQFFMILFLQIFIYQKELKVLYLNRE